MLSNCGVFQDRTRLAEVSLHDRPQPVHLRRLHSGDCLKHLTGMLHRAFSRLGEMGLPCSCVNQAPEMTRQRLARGDCFVAVSGKRIVGTITLYAPNAASDSRHYRDARIATVNQLGVDPQFQGKGVGRALLRLAENWARDHGYARLALDTPEPARHLIDYYHRQSFRAVETLQFSGRPYRSMVFVKTLLYCVATDSGPMYQPGRRGALEVMPIADRNIQQHWMTTRTNPPREER